MTSPPIIPYPEVHLVMEREFARPRPFPAKSGKTMLRPMTNLQLSKAAGMATGLISYVRQGKRRPTPVEIDQIAFAFFPRPKKLEPDHLANEREAFRNALVAAAEKPEIALTGNVLEDLAAGLITLRISSADYVPISGKQDSAFESLARRLFAVCGLEHREPEIRFYFDPHAVSPTDVLLSVFDNPDRMVRIKFWRLPLRMSLGGVCEQRYRGKLPTVAGVLAGIVPRSKLIIHPIVVPYSLAWNYCRNWLNFADSELTILQVKPNENIEEQLARALAEETIRRSSAIPVVCADEFRCFRVLNTTSLQGAGISVFPMNSLRAAQESDPRRETPQSYIGIGIRRGNAALQEYLQDALTQFFSTEIQTTALLWRDLALQLLATISDFACFPQELKCSESLRSAERWRRAWEWVKFCLHLDRASVGSYTDPSGLPWRPILQRAHRLMQQYFGSDDFEGRLRQQVKLSLSYVDKGENFNAELLRICELFDLGPDFAVMLPPQNEEKIVTRLRNSLQAANI